MNYSSVKLDGDVGSSFETSSLFIRFVTLLNRKTIIIQSTSDLSGAI